MSSRKTCDTEGRADRKCRPRARSPPEHTGTTPAFHLDEKRTLRRAQAVERQGGFAQDGWRARAQPAALRCRWLGAGHLHSPRPARVLRQNALQVGAANTDTLRRGWLGAQPRPALRVLWVHAGRSGHGGVRRRLRWAGRWGGRRRAQGRPGSLPHAGAAGLRGRGAPCAMHRAPCAMHRSHPRGYMCSVCQRGSARISMHGYPRSHSIRSRRPCHTNACVPCKALLATPTRRTFHARSVHRRTVHGAGRTSTSTLKPRDLSCTGETLLDDEGHPHGPHGGAGARRHAG